MIELAGETVNATPAGLQAYNEWAHHRNAAYYRRRGFNVRRWVRLNRTATGLSR